MKKFLIPVFLFLAQDVPAQKSLPDSTMKEFTRLTCECATLMKIDQTAHEKAIQDLGTCINTTVSVFESNGWIKKEWLDDSVWSRNFDSEMQVSLLNFLGQVAALWRGWGRLHASASGSVAS